MPSRSTQDRSPARRPRPPKGKTEEDLLRVATALFGERGFNGVSVAEIAEAAGVTNAGVYYYFRNKQDLLFRVLESALTGYLSRLEGIAAIQAPARDKLSLAIDNHLDFVLRRGDAVRVFIRERRFLEPPLSAQYQTHVDRYDTLVRGILAEGVESGEFPAMDVTVAGMLTLGAINSIVEWHKPRGRLSDEKLVEIVRQLILDGLFGSR